MSSRRDRVIFETTINELGIETLSECINDGDHVILTACVYSIWNGRVAKYNLSLLSFYQMQFFYCERYGETGDEARIVRVEATRLNLQLAHYTSQYST